MDNVLADRILTGVALALLLCLVLWSGGSVLLAATFVVFVIVNYEFFRFSLRQDIRFVSQLTLASTLIPLGYVFYGWGGLFSGLVVALFSALTLNVLNVESETHEPPYSELLPASLVGLAYTGVLGTVLVSLASQEHGNILLGWLFAIVICSDTGAYFGGRFFGGPKLAPRISPNKTCSGAVVGLGCGIVGSLLFGHFSPMSLDAVSAVSFGVLIGVLAQMGDLAESLLKRIYGVKDSGDILPGHGGLLDRLDAVLFAAPALYLFPRVLA